MSEAFDKLREETLYAAQALTEENFSEAARYARRANWYWQRLPLDEQNSYVESHGAFDDGGPAIGLDYATELAFVAWFAYRCGLSMAAVRRDSEAVDEAYEAKRAADRLAAERAAAAAESTQATLFAPAIETSFRQSAKKGRLQS